MVNRQSNRKLVTDEPCTVRNSEVFINLGTGVKRSTGKTGAQSLPHIGLVCTTERLSKLKIIHMNCQSVKNKAIDFQTAIELHNPDIFIGTESWLTEDITSNEIFPPNYQVFRHDREGKRGGGVFIGTRETLTSVLNWTDALMEIMSITVNSKPHNICIIGAYRPHSCSTLNFLDAINTHLIALTSEGTTHKPFIIGGDLNLPQIKWSVEPEFTSCSVQSAINVLLDRYNMIQVIQEPTHEPNNILDIFLVSPPEIWLSSSVENGISDHKIITVTIDTSSELSTFQSNRTVWLYKNADVEGITEDLLEAYTTWSTQIGDIETYWSTLKDLLTSIRSKYVPTRTLKRNHDPIYYTKKIIELKKKSRRAFPTRKTNNKFQELRKELNKEKKVALNNHMVKLLNNEKPGNWNRFYKHIRSKKGDFNSIPAMLDAINNTLLTEDVKKANILNETYQKVFNSDPKWYINNHANRSNPSEENSSFTFNNKAILLIIKNLRFNTGYGSDGITSQIIKLSHLAIVPYLNRLFSISINNCQIPNDWRTAIVHPIFKSGARNDPSNYRPISNTSITCKIMERLITDYIHKSWKLNNQLFKNQHGFRKEYSCESSITVFTQELAEYVDKGIQVDAILLDFSKAFDVVPHNRLIDKFSGMNLDHRVIRWIENFLTNRTQSVQVGTTMSNSIKVTSGVPQGTVLGPALFIGFINDISKEIKSSIRLFADDCIIYRPIKSLDDQLALQDDLDIAQKWVRENGMKLNSAKTNVVSFTKQKVIDTHYILNNQVLVKTKNCKYLGVTMEQNLTWKNHITKMVSKANRALHFVMRNLKGSLPSTKQHAYLCLIRPLMEYCCGVWDPHTAVLNDMVNKVQRKAARYVINIHKRWEKKQKQPQISVTQLMDQLKWEPLPARRRRVVLRGLHRAISGKPAWEDLNLMTHKATHFSRTDHKYKLKLSRYNTDIGLYSFLGRATRLWNKIPRHKMTSFPEYRDIDTILDT